MKRLGNLGDRFWLLTMAMFSLFILAGVAAGAILRELPNQSQTLLGVIVGGLFTQSKDIVQAIRQFWQDERVGKMTDQLANAPPGSPEAATGKPDDPVNTIEVKP